MVRNAELVELVGNTQELDLIADGKNDGAGSGCCRARLARGMDRLRQGDSHWEVAADDDVVVLARRLAVNGSWLKRKRARTGRQWRDNMPKFIMSTLNNPSIVGVVDLTQPVAKRLLELRDSFLAIVGPDVHSMKLSSPVVTFYDYDFDEKKEFKLKQDDESVIDDNAREDVSNVMCIIVKEGCCWVGYHEESADEDMETYLLPWIEIEKAAAPDHEHLKKLLAACWSAICRNGIKNRPEWEVANGVTVGEIEKALGINQSEKT